MHKFYGWPKTNYQLYAYNLNKPRLRKTTVGYSTFTSHNQCTVI